MNYIPLGLRGARELETDANAADSLLADNAAGPAGREKPCLPVCRSEQSPSYRLLWGPSLADGPLGAWPWLSYTRRCPLGPSSLSAAGARPSPRVSPLSGWGPLTPRPRTPLSGAVTRGSRSRELIKLGPLCGGHEKRGGRAGTGGKAELTGRLLCRPTRPPGRCG